MNPWKDKRWKVVAWGVTTVVLAGLGYLLLRLLIGRRGPVADAGKLTKVVTAARNQIVEANAKAAVELAIARTQDQGVKDELASIAADDDEARRLSRLVGLRQRVVR
jgi:FAD/FMN-containing dehydrogenase